ncbi:hypothetical protein HAX54_005088 [Datura stramonium]|uniref:Uncharacterized protein n=1 Tax=Datura stramonium TaxID=4076 RepID=A0ABS8TAF1_DATST|nr:hypothetical protein [Datura stramonium]
MISSTAKGETNHYSVLILPLHTQDQQLIRTNFTNATNLLNLNQNRYPLANEAFKHELRYWYILSNRTKKAYFDDELKGKGKEGSFRTVCPYCYYVYEFFKVYEDCCLRCQNENCKRVFHALPIVGPPPPLEVAEKEGKSPLVRKNEGDFDGDEVIENSNYEIEDGNGRKEESLGV